MTVQFSRAILNQGRGYNTTNGLFTAPVRGTYVFFAKTSARTDNSVEEHFLMVCWTADIILTVKDDPERSSFSVRSI
jgi:hypothetical protein